MTKLQIADEFSKWMWKSANKHSLVGIRFQYGKNREVQDCGIQPAPDHCYTKDLARWWGVEDSVPCKGRGEWKHCRHKNYFNQNTCIFG